MAPNKTISEAATKGKFQCGECEIEFTGAVCPECGNKKGNKRMAKDGISQVDHRMTFDPPIKPLMDEFGVALTEEDLMNLQYTKMAQDEFQDNMRTSRLNMSAIKKIDSDMKLVQKKAELDRLKEGIVDSYPPPRAASQQPEMPTGPIFGVQSPQSQFLSQLMKMGDEDRAVFIEQLSDADPNALQMLNAMVTPPQQPQQMNYSNPMGMYPGYFPPAVQQESQSSESPVVLMKEMFSLMKEMQPPKDNSSSDLFRELKDDLKSIHNRIDNVMQESPGRESTPDPILNYLKHIEQKVDAGQQQPTFGEQLRSIKTMITDINEINLVNSSPLGTSVSEQIELKKLEHDIDMENKQFDFNQDTLTVQKDNQKTQKNLVQQLFSRALTKPGAEDTPDQPVPNRPYEHRQTFNPVPNQQSMEIIDEVQTETGSIREIRRTDDYIPGPE